ncbi:MDR family MFS transporter [Rapidithrix thailandica]|uniref:MDR family MFS transporter n=1 Tax=Rapidithrix thailandica TaxID=413964 RepID=A0AAW9S4X2_9BACT
MNKKAFATAGLIIGIFLGALEGTVVATAMPKVIEDLGGKHLYALPFAVYMLTSTVSSPLWGRLSDIFGRKRLYLMGVVLFVVSSMLCGIAYNMYWLIAMRALQGMGAGCLMTLTMTLVGEMYGLAERAKVQGYISGVWGFSGLVGPMIGGLIVDHISWHWVFFLNLPFGIVAMVLVYMFLEEKIESHKVKIDWPGAILFSLGTGLLVWGLDQVVIWYVLSGLALMGIAFYFEWKHPSPLLPITSLRTNISRFSIFNNLLAGAAFFGAIAYIPLFVQSVANKDASTAGIVLTPMIVGWTITSVIGARLIHTIGMSKLIVLGFSILLIGFSGFALLVHQGLYVLAGVGLVVGCGMGFGMLGTLLIVQENATAKELGASTAAISFARTIGGAIGVSTMSLIMGEAVQTGGIALADALQKAFIFGAVLTLFAFILSLMIQKAYTRQQEIPVAEELGQ